MDMTCQYAFVNKKDKKAWHVNKHYLTCKLKKHVLSFHVSYHNVNLKSKQTTQLSLHVS
jgi:hypothetical protein